MDNFTTHSIFSVYECLFSFKVIYNYHANLFKRNSCFCVVKAYYNNLTSDHNFTGATSNL